MDMILDPGSKDSLSTHCKSAACIYHTVAYSDSECDKGSAWKPCSGLLDHLTCPQQAPRHDEGLRLRFLGRHGEDRIDAALILRQHGLGAPPHPKAWPKRQLEGWMDAPCKLGL